MQSPNARLCLLGLKALCILLKRLAYPIRLSDLALYFGLSPQSLSQIINTIIDIILQEHGEVLNNLNGLQWLTREKMVYYAEVSELLFILVISFMQHYLLNTFSGCSS